jgi:hypothetical protein
MRPYDPSRRQWWSYVEDEVREILELVDAGLSTDGARVLLALRALLDGENSLEGEWVNVISEVSRKELAARAGIAREALAGALAALEACGQIQQFRLASGEDAYKLAWPTEEAIIEQRRKVRREREEGED